MTREEIELIIENNDFKKLDELATKNWKTKMELLSSDKCPLQYLEQLKYDDDGLVRQYVAKNINCTTEILNYFVETENNTNMLYKIVGNPNCTEEILTRISKYTVSDSDLLRLMIMNPNYSTNSLVERSYNADDFILNIIKEHSNCPEYLTKILDMDSKQKIEFAKSSNNINEIKYLFEIGSRSMYDSYDRDIANSGFQIMHNIIDNPNTSKELLEEIGTYDYSLKEHIQTKLINDINSIDFDKNYEITNDDEDYIEYLNRKYITDRLTNNLLSSEELNKLVYSDNTLVKCCLSNNLNLTKESLEFLLRNEKDQEIISNIAEHKQCSSEMLEVLAFNEDVSVRCRVAAHSNTPTKILDTFLRDKEIVQWSLANNSKTPKETLENMLIIGGEHTKKLVYKNLNTTEEQLAKTTSNINLLNIFSKSYDEDVRYNVASNPNLTKENIINDLANDGDIDVRTKIAQHSNISIESLIKLANDDNYFVRSCVIDNKKITKEILQTLSLDTDEEVSSKAIQKLELLDSSNYDASKIANSTKDKTLVNKNKNYHNQ